MHFSSGKVQWKWKKLCCRRFGYRHLQRSWRSGLTISSDPADANAKFTVLKKNEELLTQARDLSLGNDKLEVKENFMKKLDKLFDIPNCKWNTCSTYPWVCILNQKAHRNNCWQLNGIHIRKRYWPKYNGHWWGFHDILWAAKVIKENNIALAI